MSNSYFIKIINDAVITKEFLIKSYVVNIKTYQHMYLNIFEDLLVRKTILIEFTFVKKLN